MLLIKFDLIFPIYQNATWMITGYSWSNFQAIKSKEKRISTFHETYQKAISYMSFKLLEKFIVRRSKEITFLQSRNLVNHFSLHSSNFKHIPFSPSLPLSHSPLNTGLCFNFHEGSLRDALYMYSFHSLRIHWGTIAPTYI